MKRKIMFPEAIFGGKISENHDSDCGNKRFVYRFRIFCLPLLLLVSSKEGLLASFCRLRFPSAAIFCYFNVLSTFIA